LKKPPPGPPQKLFIKGVSVISVSSVAKKSLKSLLT
jgi:hypothetical protein